MKQWFFIIILVVVSINVFSQSYSFNSCELPDSKVGYITLEHMTGMIYDKDSKIYSICLDPKESPPKHYASVELSTSKLNIKIYDSNDKLMISNYLFDVSFQKDYNNSVAGEKDSFGYIMGKKNVFILKTKNPKESGEVTMQLLDRNTVEISIHYLVKDDNGKKTYEYVLNYFT